MTNAASNAADEVFRELMRSSQAVQLANQRTDEALRVRDHAIIAAWHLGIAARTIAQVTHLTAGRVAQIVEQELASDDAEAKRRQNRELSRKVERMNALPAAHMLQWMINSENRYDVAIWTMAQHEARTWTPDQLAEAIERYGWPPNDRLAETLEELVDVRRQIHRVGKRLYQISEPQPPEPQRAGRETNP